MSIDKTEKLKMKGLNRDNQSTNILEVKNIKIKKTYLKNVVSVFGVMVILLVVLLLGEDKTYG